MFALHIANWYITVLRNAGLVGLSDSWSCAEHCAHFPVSLYCKWNYTAPPLQTHLILYDLLLRRISPTHTRDTTIKQPTLLRIFAVRLNRQLLRVVQRLKYCYAALVKLFNCYYYYYYYYYYYGTCFPVFYHLWWIKMYYILSFIVMLP